MGYDSYAQIFNLEEVSFIAGTEFTFDFPVFDKETGQPLNLNAATITWTLGHYGLDYTVVTLSINNGITVTGENTFRVVLDGETTVGLQGKFIQQPKIVDFNGSTFLPGQGMITILPAM